MNKRVYIKQAMYRVVLSVIAQHQPIWGGLGAFAGKYNQLVMAVDALDELAHRQQELTVGLTADKNKNRKILTGLLLENAGILSGYAQDTQAVDLQTEIKALRKDISRIPEAELAIKADRLQQLLTVHLTDLADFGFDQAKMDAFAEAIDNWNACVGDPRAAIVVRKSYTQQLMEQIRLIDETLKEGWDQIMISFRKTNVAFYKQYKNARRLVDKRGKSNGTALPEPDDGVADA